MNYKRYVLLFNIFFLLLLIAATLLFEWKPGIAGPAFRPLDILSDVIKDSSIQHKHVKDKINIVNGNNNHGNTEQRDYTTYAGLINNSDKSTVLYDFFTHLKELQQKKRKKIRIGYFGDSMIEGDQITKDLRRLLQDAFGGNGVGFVPVTSVVASFRQTVGHSFSSNWKDVNYKSNDKASANLFISGHSFFSANNSEVTYGTVKHRNLDSFSNVCVLFGSPTDIGNAYANILVNDISFPIHAVDSVNKLELKTTNAKEVKISITSTTIPLYGVAFEGDSGIVLDNFSFRGISGVELNYFTAEYLRRVQATRPYDLMVFQFGPNLLSRSNLTDFSWYTNKMGPTLQKIKNTFPQTSLLLISTADKGFSYNGSWHTEKGVVPLIEAQFTMAKSVGVDFFNLYNAMGGEDAIVRWVNGDTVLARKDYTHPNNLGAQKFAEFIFNAIMKEYQEYERHIDE